MNSQGWKLDKTIELTETPSSYSVDVQGNIYLGYAHGKMTKYNSDGEELLNYSLSNQSKISLIEAINSLKIFLFYQDNQQITILDRFSAVPKNYHLRELGVDFGMMACPSPDNHYWVIENNPQRLKKIDPNTGSLVMEIQVSLGDDIYFMRSLQNLLIVCEGTHLYLFNQFGSLLNTIKLPGTRYAQMAGDHLLVFDGNGFRQIDPLTGKIISTTKSPNPEAWGGMKSKERYLMVSSDALRFYLKND